MDADKSRIFKKYGFLFKILSLKKDMYSSIIIFGKTIHLYGVFCMVGIVLAIIVAFILARKQGLEFFNFALVALVTLISAFFGAKLLFYIVSWKSVFLIFQSLSFIDAVMATLQGGFVFYGGLIGGIIGLFVILKIQKEDFFKYSNIYAVVLPLGHAFGRVGCFFAGCCYGIKHSGFLSYTYSNALDVSTPLGVPLLAVQLIEALALVVLFLILLLVYLKFSNNKIVSFLYMITYSILRFILEFFRGDLERGLLLNLSTSQWISLLIIIVGLICLFKKRNTANKKVGV